MNGSPGSFPVTTGRIIESGYIGKCALTFECVVFIPDLRFVFLFALRGAINIFFMQLVELAEVNLLVSSRRPPGDPYTVQRSRIINQRS